MPAALYLHLVLVCILIGAQHLWRSYWYSIIRGVIVVGIIGTLALALYYTHAQFIVWSTGGAPSIYLVPPYSGISYMLFYAWWRFFAPYVLSGLLGLLFYYLATKLNQKYEERFFYPTEPAIIGFCIFTVGHPLWIAYLAGTLALFVCALLMRRYLFKNKERFAFYFLWLPVAAVFLGALPFLRSAELFLLLKV
jgi:hypothetical protein